MIESEFTFLEVWMKRMSGNTIEFCKLRLAYDQNDSMPLISSGDGNPRLTDPTVRAEITEEAGQASP